MIDHQSFRTANDPLTSVEQLTEFLFSESTLLQCAAIENISTPPEAVETLKNSRNFYIRQALNRRGFKIDPIIAKVKQVSGKNIILKNASTLDAKFILSLRCDPDKNQYISSVSGELDDQVKWLQNYEIDENQSYFIIQDKTSAESIGTVRIYDQQENSFCWGSWILKKNIQPNIAIESALLVYQYGLAMGFTKSHFDVRKENNSVWKFHERFGAIRVGETKEDYLYQIEYNNIMSAFSRYQKYLADDFDIIPL